MLRLAIIALFGLIYPITSLAQTAPKGETVLSLVQCDVASEMLDVIEGKFSETNLATGRGVFVIATPEGPKTITGNVRVWVNADELSFSVTIDNGTLMCMLSSGGGFAPGNAPAMPKQDISL